MATATVKKRNAPKTVTPKTVTPATVEVKAVVTETVKENVVSIPKTWKEVQKLAKSLGIKASGKGVNMVSLSKAIADFKASGTVAPEFTKKAPKVSNKETVANHVMFNGMSFREAQAHVKALRNDVMVHKATKHIKASSWAGLNQIATLIAAR